ncbi:hypothetical protein JCM1841_003165 [Sporobolomyces salmonicolor]
MAAPLPSSIVIPASPLDAKLLSASSLAWTPHPQPTSSSAAPSTAARAAQQEKHFITKREFDQWQGSNPRESKTLRPPVGVDGVPDKITLQGYRAPQHPVSHVLQSIPPRAPSRSSRFNILSYTLHLATSSRLSSYASANGTRSLLHWAEFDALQPSDEDGVEIDHTWFEVEHKTQGLWKLGVNLLESSRREGALPPSVERRVVLAGLTEDLLVSPSTERAITKIDSESVQPSTEVEELQALKPLTSPDTTTLYLSTSTHGAGGVAGLQRERSQSVAQSLIDLKFGGKRTDEESSPRFVDEKPLVASASAVDASPSTSASASIPHGFLPPAELTATPHMDYRIVLSQSMRHRAKSIFSHSPLPSLTSSWCRRHRVSSCSVCAKLIAETEARASDHATERKRNLPGAGLRHPGGGHDGAKKALVALVPTFLKLSAALMKDLKDRANGVEPLGGAEESMFAAVVEEKGKGKAGEVEMHVTAAWYELLSSLLVQACLEGYLVDGWIGTEGVETLFGVGCGVWEGRGWSTAQRPGPSPSRSSKKVSVKLEDVEEEGDEEDETDSEDEESVEELRVRERERETKELVEAAHTLFGARDVAQAEYERGMRDRIHQFLNVPQNQTLHQHLDSLNARYPLSRFEDDMVDFLEAATRMLGKPALARYNTRPTPSSSSPSTTPSVPPTTLSVDPDPFALLRYFSQTPNTRSATPAPAEPVSHPHRAWEDSTESSAGLGGGPAGKRQRVD